MFSGLSLKYRIALVIFVLEAVMMTTVLWQTLASSLEANHRLNASNEKVLLTLLADLSSSALLTEELADIQLYFEQVVHQPNVEHIMLADTNNRIVASNLVEEIGGPLPELNTSETRYWRIEPVVTPAGNLGVVAIEFSTDALVTATTNTRNLGIAIAAVGMIIILLIGLAVGYALTRRLNYITRAARGFAEGNASSESNIRGSDEIGVLGQTFDQMVRQVASANTQLRAKSEHIQLLMNSTAEAILGTDSAGKCIFANPACQRILGYRSEEELLGRMISATVLDEHDSGASLIQRTIDRGEALNGDDRSFKRADGSSFPAEYWSHPIVSDNQVAGVVLTFVDITQRKQTEATVRKLVRAVEQSPNAIIITDKQGVIEYVNPRFIDSTGYSSGEAVGNTPRLLSSGETKNETYRQLWKTITCGHVWQGELRNRHKDGMYYWDHVAISPVKDENGDLSHFVSIQTDITEHKRIEHELREYRENLEHLVNQRTATVREQARIIDQIHDAVVSVDTVGTVTSWNRGAELLFGYNREEAFGKHISFLVPDSPSRTQAENLAEVLANERTEHDFEARMRRKNSTEFCVHLSLSQLCDSSGTPKGFVFYAIDITARKNAEALANQRALELTTVNRELEAFCYSVSHDLRTPLRSIAGFSQALLEDYSEILDDLGKDHLDRVRKAAQHMSDLIDDLLQLSRVSRCAFARETLPLDELAQQVFNELSRNDPGREVSFYAMPNLTVEADKGLLRSAVQNLIENAWKYSQKHPHATIEVGRTKIEGEAVFYVRDDGAGFDMKYANQLFRPFHRLHDSHEFEGTGIGLATVARIVQRHGGKVWARSEVEKGATFFFTLPTPVNNLSSVNLRTHG